MPKLEFHKKFADKFKKLNKKEQKRIYKRLLLLENFPFISLDLKKLKGYKNMYRLRVGKYRIIFILMDNKVVLYDIELREKSYKKK
ncbi:MAG: type II toxin-antitoxin system RelE/ParE family toxin [Methanosarcinales archaeon]